MTSKTLVTKSFDERIVDLKEYKQTHGHVNVTRKEDNSLYQFCVDVRYSLKQSEKNGLRHGESWCSRIQMEKMSAMIE